MKLAGCAVVAACLLFAVGMAVAAGDSQSEKMTKYYKRTGQKFLDEKAKVLCFHCFDILYPARLLSHLYVLASPGGRHPEIAEWNVVSRNQGGQDVGQES